MPITLSSARSPWKSLLVLACAFLLLGAAGEGDTTLMIAMLGAVLSVGGAGVGYGLTKAAATTAKERAEQAHARIGHLEMNVANGIKDLTGEVSDLRFELAQAGVLRAGSRPITDGR